MSEPPVMATIVNCLANSKALETCPLQQKLLLLKDENVIVEVADV